MRKEVERAIPEQHTVESVYDEGCELISPSGCFVTFVLAGRDELCVQR